MTAPRGFLAEGHGLSFMLFELDLQVGLDIFGAFRDYAKHTHPLPVVFDDVFVNFSGRETRKAVRELTETYQVLLFTCHPQVLAMAKDALPTTVRFPSRGS